jgi:hypothetical protein
VVFVTTATLSKQDLIVQVNELVAPFGEATQRHIGLLLDEALSHHERDAIFFLRIPYGVDRVTCEEAEAWHHTIERFNMSTRTVRALNELLETVGLQYLAFCGCGDCIIPLTSEDEEPIVRMEKSLMLRSHSDVVDVSFWDYSRFMAPRYARLLERHGMP